MEGKFMDKLFSNPGKQIKNLAQWGYVIEMVCALIGAFSYLLDERFGMFFLALILVPTAGYFMNLLLYAFGELVEGTSYAKKISEELSADHSEMMKEIDELPEI